MKVAVYSHYFVPEIGAPSARIYDLAREWIAAGDDVDVVTCFPNHPTGVLYPGYEDRRRRQEDVDGIHVHRAWSYVTPNRGFVKKTLGHVSFYPTAIAASRRLEEADVFVGTSPTFFAAMAAERVATFRGRPFIMEVRDLWPAIFVELGVLKNRAVISMLERLELWLYRRAAHVVTVTEAFRQDLLRRGVPDQKVTTIPNGANTEFWRDDGGGVRLRAKFGLQDAFVVLYIGAHGISQALTAILRAAARLRDRTSIRFVFVGEGAEKDQLVRFAADEGLSNVTFLDPVGKEEVRDFYSMADVCLVPLRNIPLFETFIPSKMFEILAMERPIIASLSGEAAGILDRSGAAVVVPPEDDVALARAICELESDSARRTSMGARGRQFVIESYSRRALADRYRAVMKQAIGAYAREA